MPVSDIAGRVAIAAQLSMGVNPRDILVEHYSRLWRASKVARSSTASEYREAMETVALAKPGFFVELARALDASLVSIIEMFKNSRVARFFGKIGWSLKKLWGLLKDGYRHFKTVLNAVADYVAETKVMRWTKEELSKLDEYLREHPRIKTITGVAVGAILVYLWFVMADIGDVDWDFDLSDVVAALGGTYSLADIFAGREGSKLLMALAVGGLTGLSFPWPVANSVGFVVAVVKTIAKKMGIRLRPARVPVEQEAEALA